jgi:hypothetical protein
MYSDNKDSFLQPKVSQYGSHMVMTNVSKPTQKKVWNIDTRFHDDYDNYSRMVNGTPIPWYTFTLPQPINDVKSITVNNVELPISFYNVSASLGNNVMQIISNGTSSLIIIPDGYYTSASLKTAVSTAIAALSGVTFDISYNGLANAGGNQYSSFRNGSSYALTFNFAVKASKTSACTNVTASGATADFDKFNFKSKLGWLLGFRNITYTLATGAYLYSESVIDLNTPRYLYLVLDEFTHGNQNSFVSPMPSSIVNKNILAKISLDPLHYTFGTLMPANEYNGLLKSDKRTYNGKVNLQKLKIQLVTEYGHPINLNGLDFSFCTEIEYE